MIRYVKWTVLEVGAGILLTGIIGTVLLGCLTGFSSKETIGFAVGILAALALFYTMGVTVEDSLDTGDRSTAKRSARRAYVMRMVFIVLGTWLASKYNLFNVVTALLALFSIKVGLFFQPVTHKLFCRWFNLTDELSPDALYLSEEEVEDEDVDDDDGDKPDRIDRWLERIYGKR